jgi:hypothetical protein
MRLSGGGVTMNPKPADGAKGVDVHTQLSWSAGAHAATHNLYLGTSQAAVTNANGASDPSVTFAPIKGTSFDPNGLQFNTQYFWRVDAVNDGRLDLHHGQCHYRGRLRELYRRGGPRNLHDLGRRL